VLTGTDQSIKPGRIARLQGLAIYQSVISSGWISCWALSSRQREIIKEKISDNHGHHISKARV